MKTGIQESNKRSAARGQRAGPGRWVLALVLALTAVTSSCTPGSLAPEPAISSLVVRNHSSMDVNVYVLPSVAGQAMRLGTVVGAANTTFALKTQHLQPGGVLVVRLHAIGSVGSWTSEAVTVGDGVLAILDVDTDPFGDCSRSILHTIVTADTVTRLRR